MRRKQQHYTKHYEDINVFADPLYGYISFTKSVGDQPAEETLIDSPWVQRLRRIHQLQSVWWVFPAAEHSRFQHVIGVMHLAGQFADHLYDFLQDTVGPDNKLPSKPKFVETARIAGLLHDVGHGPFGHFFDEKYLRSKYGEVNHEVIGQKVIRTRLNDIIENIRVSPVGQFEADEKLSAEDIAYIIRKPSGPDREQKPEWLQVLHNLFTGIYTVDNLDYICRDAYLTGVSRDAVDVPRLLYYTHIQRDAKGHPVVALHIRGLSTLKRFLQIWLFMYEEIYNHRTALAIEIEMEDAFADAIEEVLQKNPLDDLDSYFKLDDWSLISWAAAEASSGGKHARTWDNIINRKPTWQMVFESREYVNARSAILNIDTPQRKSAREQEFATEVYQKLSPDTRQDIAPGDIHVEIISLYPRPEKFRDGNNAVQIYDPTRKKLTLQRWDTILAGIPNVSYSLRVYLSKPEYSRLVAEAAAQVIQQHENPGGASTNI